MYNWWSIVINNQQQLSSVSTSRFDDTLTSSQPVTTTRGSKSRPGSAATPATITRASVGSAQAAPILSIRIPQGTSAQPTISSRGPPSSTRGPPPSGARVPPSTIKLPPSMPGSSDAGMTVTTETVGTIVVSIN